MKFAGIICIVIAIFLIGTVAYHELEDWRYVDSFYFTGATVLTIGYGDLHPTTDVSKIFTVFFGFSGIGMILLIMTIISQHFYQQQERLRKKAEEHTIKAVQKYQEIMQKLKAERKKRFIRLRRGIIAGSRH
jgi:hypothetical protein